MTNPKSIENTIIANEKIVAKRVRVTSEDGEQLGIMDISDALKSAYSKNLDLVLVTDKSDPPVVKIADLNKYNYELKRRQKEKAKIARQNVIDIKEIVLRPGISDHDMLIKMKQVAKFIEKGSKVKITIQLRGRAITRGNEVLAALSGDIDAMLADFKYEQPLKQAGNRITGIITKNG